MREVFCTRKLGEDDCKKIQQEEIKITNRNFIEIDPVINKEQQREVFDLFNKSHRTLVFTSKNAVRLAMKNYLQNVPKDIGQTWRFYCLSGSTRKKILEHFAPEQIIGTADNASGLCRQLLKQKYEEPVHFFCGNRRRNILPNFMKRQEIPFKEWIVYNTRIAPGRIEDVYEAYLFYSPSAVESFFSVNSINACKPCFSIGATTAASLRARVRNPIFTSEKPDTRHLLTLLSDYFKKRNAQI